MNALVYCNLSFYKLFILSFSRNPVTHVIWLEFSQDSYRMTEVMDIFFEVTV